MSTLSYADEVIDPAEIDELQGLTSRHLRRGAAGVAGRVAGRVRTQEAPR
jgi:hypothetical protein